MATHTHDPPTSSGRFSDLEGFVLGLVWQFGPVSPYEVRQIMLDSPSTQWSASTGAIYPLMRKLERTGLVKGRSERKGKRASRSYAVTPAGVTRLRSWLGPPLSREAVSVVYDPLRTRARFLGVLRPEQRGEWIAAALGALDEVQRAVERWNTIYPQRAPGSERHLTLAFLTRHAELDLHGRRQWLADVRDAVAVGSKPARRRKRKEAQ